MRKWNQKIINTLRHYAWYVMTLGFMPIFTVSLQLFTMWLIPILFHRFPNITSHHLTTFHGDRNNLLCQISKFPFNLKSLKLSNQTQFPAKGLRALSKKITTLTSFTYSSFSIKPISHIQTLLFSKTMTLFLLLIVSLYLKNLICKITIYRSFHDI
jgi:hypothetical protein